MKYYYTFSFEKLARLYLVVFTLVVFQTNVGLAQSCALSCNGSTQVSLSEACDATITPNMILSDNGASCPSPYLRVEVSDASGNLINVLDRDEVTAAYMGQTLTVSVIDNVLNDTMDPPRGSGNSCWGVIIVEDKFGPSIMEGCTAGLIDTVINCADLASFEGPVFKDNCDGDLQPIVLSDSIVTCPSPDFIKSIHRTYSAVDNKGNRAANVCNVVINLEGFDIGKVTFPDDIEIECDVASAFDTQWDEDLSNDTIPVSLAGSPIYRVNIGSDAPVYDTTELYPYPDIYCNTSVVYTDIVLPEIGCSQKIYRNWQIRVWSCPGSSIPDTTYSHRQVIEITDETAPVINTTADGTCMINGEDKITVSTNTLISALGSGDYGDFNCGVSTSLCLPVATDNCLGLHGATSGITNCEGGKNPLGLKYDLTYDSGFIADYNGEEVILPMGTSVVLFTVYDDCFNSSQCHLPVEIIDDTPPIAICDQNTTVSLTSDGTAYVGASSFDDGSYDDCKDHCTLVRKMNADDECRAPDLCDLNYLGERNGNHYYLSTYEISATIAKKRATAYGGSLVKFDDSDEETWVTGAVRRTYSGRYWIGMKREGSGFRWDDHTLVTDTNANWAPGQPSNAAGEDCVMVTPGDVWNDAPCDGEWRYVLEVSSECSFSSTVSFTCPDADTDEMVVFRIVDFYGNFNDCMVNVFVQNKSTPVLNCPADRTVSCEHIYNPNDLNTAFGPIELGESCLPNVIHTVRDTFGGCGIGYIERRWTAYNADTTRELSHCKQIITFENSNPFEFDPETQCPEREILIDECVTDDSSLDPALLGAPHILSGQCDLIGTDVTDQRFTFDNTSGNPICFKLIRTWDIVDWCSPFRRWNCVQVIKVTDTQPVRIAPEFPDDVEFDDKGVPVFKVYECEGGPASLNFVATDVSPCTPLDELDYSYVVLRADGSSSDAISGTGDRVTVSGNYPIGEHTVHLTYYDNCGNTSTFSQPFIISNRKAATAYCLNGVAVDIMPISTNGGQVPNDAMIELWASDLDAGSSHPCDYEVYLSFSEDINNTNRTFTCSDIGLQEVRVYVTIIAPDGYQVQTFCTTYVDIQNNHAVNPCIQFTTVNVEGTIATETAQVIEDVQVTLEGGNTEAFTDTNGDYAFPAMGTGGDYIVDPSNNSIPLNGVSTLDLVMIQRHILGIETLDSPYKIIAADINANNIIDGVDLVELRKLILGIYSDLPENDSWRFVDKDYQFQNAQAPLAENFSENYEIINLGQNMSIDFVAVKIGDVDGTVDALLSGESTTNRNSSSTITMKADQQELSNNELITIPLAIASSTSVTGFQFELAYDATQVEVQNIQGVNIELTESNYNLQEGSIGLSWSSSTAVLDAQIEVTVRTLNSVKLNEVFDINQESSIAAEVYDEEMSTRRLLMSPSETQSELVLQNNPNPFNAETELMFYLSDKSMTDIIITDVQGRVVKSMTQELESGLNTMTLNKTDLGNPGIYYLTVRTSSYNEMIKLVLLD